MSQAAAVPRSAVPRGAVAAVVALQVGVGLPVFLLSTLAPYIRREISLDAQTLGVVIALFYGTSSASAVWLGRVADRQSWERGLTVAATALTVVLLLAWSAVWTLPALVAVLIGAALSQSLAVATANRALAQVVPVNRQGLAFGIKHAAVPASMLLAGLAAPLVAEQIGWRWAYLLAATCPLLAAGLVARQTKTARRSGRDRRPGPVNRPGEVPVADGKSSGPRRLPELAAAPTAGEVRKLARADLHQLRTVALAAGFGAFTSGSLGAFFVLFAVSRDVPPDTAGLAVAGSSAVNVAVRLLVGAGVDRYRWHPLRVAVWLLLGGAGGFLLLAASGGWLLVAGAVLAYGAGWAWQGLLHLGAVRFWPGAPGHATGVVRTGIAAGAGTGPLLSGVLIASAGYVAVWLLLAGMAVTAATALLLVAGRRAAATGFRNNGKEWT